MMSGHAGSRTPPVINALTQPPRKNIDRFLRVGDVSAMVGLGKTTIYKYVSERRFPVPVALGGNRVAWLESEVLNWMLERVAEREKD